MDIMEAVRARRSARAFLSDPVPEAAIRDMLEAAQLAPSGGNGQDHLFGIIDDPELKRELARAAGEQWWIADAPVVIACCAWLDDDLANLPEDDFGLIVNRLRFGGAFIDSLNALPDRKAVSTLFSNAAPLIPTEHMVLAAASHGLSACMIGYLDVAEAGRILNLPDNAACLFLLPVGYAAEPPKQKHLKSIDEIRFFNRYPQSGR